jgi:hypothetical protein
VKLDSGFFDPEAIDPKFKNVDAAAGTVDIEYNLLKDLARLNFMEVMVVVVYRYWDCLSIFFGKKHS